MNYKQFWLCCLLFSIPFTLWAETKTLSQWIKFQADAGISLFYSSDFLSVEQLNQPISLSPPITLSGLNQAISTLGLTLEAVDGDNSQAFVIRPANTEVKTTLIIQAYNQETDSRVKQFKLEWPNGERLNSQAGAIVLTDIEQTDIQPTLTAVDFYPQTINTGFTSGETQIIHAQLTPLPLSLSDIRVSTSLTSFDYGYSSQQMLSRQDLADHVLVNHDPLRATERMAGNASNGISGKVHTRGGNLNETLVMFDNQELRNPYHFKDFFSLFSTINDSVVDSIEYYSGVFPVQYGGRLSAVLDVQSNQWADLPSHEANIGLLTSSYTFRHNNPTNDRHYLMALRTGGQLINDSIIEDVGVNPEFDDGYFKAEQQVNEQWQMSQHLLVSRDEIGIEQDDETANADYHDQNLWLQWRYDNLQQHQMNWQLYSSRRHDRRHGALLDDNTSAFVSEELISRFQGIKFEHQWQINDMFLFSYGLNLATEDTQIESFRDITHDSELVNELGLGRSRNTQFSFDEDGLSAQSHANIRYMINDQWTLDLGFHYKYQEWVDGGGLSPRFNVAYFINENTSWRLGLGRHQQTQHIDELLLEDPEPRYFKPASADLAVIEFNHQLDNDWFFRSELYYKKYSQTQPYYENLFNPLHVLPDLYYDRIRLAPDDAKSVGAEFTLKGHYDKINWRVSYIYSNVKDQFEQTQVLRSWNQNNAFKFHLSWPVKSWTFNLDADYHDGWPRTDIIQIDSDLLLSERNKSFHKDFYQLNVNMNKAWQNSWGAWQFEVQLTNAFNTDNPCCRNYQLIDSNLSFKEKNNLPIVPNLRLGLSW